MWKTINPSFTSTTANNEDNLASVIVDMNTYLNRYRSIKYFPTPAATQILIDVDQKYALLHLMMMASVMGDIKHIIIPRIQKMEYRDQKEIAGLIATLNSAAGKEETPKKLIIDTLRERIQHHEANLSILEDHNQQLQEDVINKTT